MAEKKRNTKPSSKPARRTRRRAPAGTKTLAQLFKERKKRDALEFKPDVQKATWIKTNRLTKQQQLRLTRWTLYVLTVVASLVLQDVLMSQFSFLGATTDLPACAILLITVLEGTEVGSIFVLIAATLYYFSGNAPTAWCIGLMVFFGIGATLFRQMYWHRSKGSVILCAAIALAGYELGLFVVGLTNALTHWGRLPSFVMTAVYSCLVLIPLYSLIYKIGLIGGNTWKE
jgi:hypothetical protein